MIVVVVGNVVVIGGCNVVVIIGGNVVVIIGGNVVVIGGGNVVVTGVGTQTFAQTPEAPQHVFMMQTCPKPQSLLRVHGSLQKVL